MAWSDAARAAALESRRTHGAVAKSTRRNLIYTRPQDINKGVHINRSEMAAYIREARSVGLRGKSNQAEMLKMATGRGEYFTNVKGAHFGDQGLKGLVWRSTRKAGDSRRRAPAGGVPKWSAKSVKYTKKY